MLVLRARLSELNSTLMEEAWFSSMFKGNKNPVWHNEHVSFATYDRGRLQWRFGGKRPVSASDFFQSWPKRQHLVLIRDFGCDNCSERCEDLAAACIANRGTRTKYTNISTVIMCQVKQAIEGSGWMCWEAAESKKQARWVTWTNQRHPNKTN